MNAVVSLININRFLSKLVVRFKEFTSFQSRKLAHVVSNYTQKITLALNDEAA